MYSSCAIALDGIKLHECSFSHCATALGAPGLSVLLLQVSSNPQCADSLDGLLLYRLAHSHHKKQKKGKILERTYAKPHRGQIPHKCLKFGAFLHLM